MRDRFNNKSCSKIKVNHAQLMQCEVEWKTLSNNLDEDNFFTLTNFIFTFYYFNFYHVFSTYLQLLVVCLVHTGITGTPSLESFFSA